MKGDFTRDTFQPAKNYSRVLMQQGRVTLDADYNEQTAILLHYLRALARDVIGPFAAPVIGGGFQLMADPKGGLLIGAGRYYVNGILIENPSDCSYAHQPSYPIADADPLLAEIKSPTGLVFWLYLDVWERLVTSIEDPQIREVALNGPDTCARSQVVWQVRALPQPAIKAGDSKNRPKIPCDGPLAGLKKQSAMTARLDPGFKSADPCVLAPDSKYRGFENQLYRIEVHTPGKAGTATLKWSRDNGSTVSAWVGTEGNNIRVQHSRGFAAGDWLELTDENRDLLGLPGPLAKVVKVEGDLLTVDPGSLVKPTDITFDPLFVNPKVRRWNQSDNAKVSLFQGAVPIVEPTAQSPAWIDLEDGLQVQFAADGVYQAGDYWLVPARVATGTIEWPAAPGPGGTTVPSFLPPRGVQHHYAPLGYVLFDSTGMKQQSCRCTFDPLTSCFQVGSGAVGQQLVSPTSGAAPVTATPVLVHGQ